jgi:hypothetical protein
MYTKAIKTVRKTIVPINNPFAISACQAGNLFLLTKIKVLPEAQNTSQVTTADIEPQTAPTASVMSNSIPKARSKMPHFIFAFFEPMSLT